MSISNLLVPNTLQINAANFQKNETANTVTTSITAAQFYNGIAIVNTTAGAVSCQLPTAAALVAANPNASVGNVVKCLFAAFGADGNAITLTTNTGLTLNGVPRVLGNDSRLVYIRFTNVGSGSEAAVVY